MSLINDSRNRNIQAVPSVDLGDQLRTILSDDGVGLARFHCEDEKMFRAVCREVGDIWRHRDSDAAGVTIIEERSDQDGAGNLGFSANELRWHTDSSGHPSPPRITLLWCAENEARGGDSLVASASAVYENLRRGNPVLWKSLHADGAATFYSGRDRYVGPVLMPDGDAIKVRLRLDDLGHLSYPVASAVREFVAALDDVAHIFRLAPGEGYALRNDRWVHARRSYAGRRRMLRVFIA